MISLVQKSKYSSLLPLGALGTIGLVTFYVSLLIADEISALIPLFFLVVLVWAFAYVALGTGLYSYFFRLWGKFFNYLIVGFANTGVDFLVFNILSKTTGYHVGWPVFLFNTISLSAGTLHSYFWTRSFTFQTTSRRSVKQFGLFWFLTILGGCLASTIILVGSRIVSHGGDISLITLNLLKVGAQIVWIISNFVCYKKFVFTS